MHVTLLIIHLVLALALVAVVLLQRSEGGALGIGGGGGGGGGLMSARGAANLLTRATTWLAAGFLVTSLTLAILAGEGRQGSSVLDEAERQQQEEQQEEEGPSVPVPDN